MTFGRFAVDYEQRIYNPERMRKYRLDRAHASMKKHGVGAMVLYDFDNFRYTGYCIWHNYMRRRPGRFLLLIRDDGFPYCPKSEPGTGEYELMPWLRDKMKLEHQTYIQCNLSMDHDYTVAQWAQTAEEVKSYLKQHNVADEPVGIDCHFGIHTVRAFDKAGINLVDGNPVMADARMIKSEDEIECIRTAGSIVESAHWEVMKAIKPGMTEWQLNGIAAKACYDGGAEELEGPSFIACSGPRFGRYGVATGTDRVIRPGEMFIQDINGVSFQGYRTCFYRTCCVGDKPTEFQKEIYNDTYEIQKAMQDNIKPGITTHQYLQNLLDEGKGKWFGPKLPEPGKRFQAGGHQLGLASGDPGPRLLPYQSDRFAVPPFTIQKNMVLTPEVGVRYFDGKQWAYDAAKTENVGVVTDTGFEVFYRFPYKELIACGLPGLY